MKNEQRMEAHLSHQLTTPELEDIRKKGYEPLLAALQEANGRDSIGYGAYYSALECIKNDEIKKALEILRNAVSKEQERIAKLQDSIRNSESTIEHWKKIIEQTS